MDQKIFTSQVRVLYGDTDAAGVVYNANYFKYFEIGRTEMMRNQVCSYKEIESMGIVLPVIECFSRFKSPAFYDDLLTIETFIGELKKYTCKFNYRVVRPNPESGRSKLLVKGYTIHAPINRTDGKLTELPEEILKKLATLAPQT